MEVALVEEVLHKAEASPVLVRLAAPLLAAALLEEEASVHPQLFLRQSLESEER